MGMFAVKVKSKKKLGSGVMQESKDAKPKINRLIKDDTPPLLGRLSIQTHLHFM